MIGRLRGVFAPAAAHTIGEFEELGGSYGDLAAHSNARELVSDILRVLNEASLRWPDPLPDTRDVLERYAGRSLEAVYIALFDAAAAKQGARHWVSKDLENVYRLGKLIEARSDLGVLHVIRDPRDVALSFRQSPIHSKDPAAIALRWERDQAAAMTHKDLVRVGRWIEIRYERLIQDPGAELARLAEECGTEPEGELRDFFRTEEAYKASQLSKLWSNLASPLKPDNVGKFHDPADREFVETVEETCFETMMRFGFEPVYATEQRRRSLTEWHDIFERDIILRQLKRAESFATDKTKHSQHLKTLNWVRAARNVRPVDRTTVQVINGWTADFPSPDL
jgi:hypothetical protein